jgi:8-oxo-dGTP diphosphatase
MSAAYNALYRLALRCAYRSALFWWWLARPPHVGAVVALWCGEELLLVRDSYRRLWSVPGGGVGKSEQPAEAARRELAEETGIALPREALRFAVAVPNLSEYRPDTVHIFEARLADRPAHRLDNREIIEARWATVEEALRLTLAPHVRDYLTRAPAP